MRFVTLSAIIDALAQFAITEGSDKRQLQATVSERTITEQIWRVVNVDTSSSTKLGQYSMATDSGPKIILAKTDKACQIHMDNTSGNGVAMAANGFALAYTNGVTNVYLQNDSATDIAKVEVAIFLVTSS